MTDARALIGQPGSRALLPTPALVLDLDRFEANLAKMADHCRARGLALRPHAKSHRSASIARRQLASGAIGQSCAKLGEAEALADAGIGGLLITSPVLAIDRLVALNQRTDGLMTVVDNPANVAQLGAAATARPLRLVVDLDVGLNRTGAANAAAAEMLAVMIADHPALEFAGVQAYAGHLMHVPGLADRTAQLTAAMAELALLRDRFAARGLAVPLYTGGGTGSIGIDADMGLLTEVQPGSYPFMDTQYEDIWNDAGEAAPFEASLFVQSTVISANHPGLATLDAGYKAFATDAGVPRILAGAPSASTYFFFGDEHGGLRLPDPDSAIAIGTVVTCSVPHCDPTINLYDTYHVVRGDTLVDLWPIEARGRSQ